MEQQKRATRRRGNYCKAGPSTPGGAHHSGRAKMASEVYSVLGKVGSQLRESSDSRPETWQAEQYCEVKVGELGDFLFS